MQPLQVLIWLRTGCMNAFSRRLTRNLGPTRWCARGPKDLGDGRSGGSHFYTSAQLGTPQAGFLLVSDESNSQPP